MTVPLSITTSTSSPIGINDEDSYLVWLFSVPTVFLACASFISIFLVYRANNLQQQRLIDSLPVVKRANDYLILSLINMLIISDLFYITFFAANSIPDTIDVSDYDDTSCLIVGIGNQLFCIYGFGWHTVLSLYIFYILHNKNNQININTRYSNFQNNYSSTKKLLSRIATGLFIFSMICAIIPLFAGKFFVFSCWSEISHILMKNPVALP